MSVTSVQIATVRRMVDEPTTAVYDDDAITAFIEEFPKVDRFGNEKYEWDTTTQPPTASLNPDWLEDYDLNAAASKVWAEKAALLAEDYDYVADGASLNRCQPFAHARKMAAYFKSRSCAKGLPLKVVNVTTNKSAINQS